MRLSKTAFQHGIVLPSRQIVVFSVFRYPHLLKHKKFFGSTSFDLLLNQSKPKSSRFSFQSLPEGVEWKAEFAQFL